ncbi:E3 ubiquitin-protein ligase [Aphelenchoides fujianensis]|nr:E3 ubiquitin-protein ligase [Aphelenchoides fujianensis]
MADESGPLEAEMGEWEMSAQEDELLSQTVDFNQNELADPGRQIVCEVQPLGESLFVFCRHKCPAFRLTAEEIHQHEAECAERPYACPLEDGKCTWEGPLSEVVDHLLQLHEMKESTMLQGIFLQHRLSVIEKNTPKCVQRLVAFDGRRFLIVLMRVPHAGGLPRCFAFLRFVGPPEQAVDYTLSMFNGNELLVWQGAPLSVRLSCAQVAASRRCLSFDHGLAQAMTWSGQRDGNFRLLFELKNTRSESPSGV